MTQKQGDFELFKQVVQIMNNKEHLTDVGFYKVLSIKAALRNGLTEVLAESFPNILPVAYPSVIAPKHIDPN